MYQKLIIIGNLGGDPNMRYTPDGKPVTSFSVAVSDRKDETMWVRVSAWNKLAETCNQYLHKGSKVLVEGRLKAEPTVFQKKDGSYSTSYEMLADKVRFLSGNGEAEVSPDDVPF
jgi:single-strand DNA-binding protein